MKDTNYQPDVFLKILKTFTKQHFLHLLADFGPHLDPNFGPYIYMPKKVFFQYESYQELLGRHSRPFC